MSSEFKSMPQKSAWRRKQNSNAPAIPVTPEPEVIETLFAEQGPKLMGLLVSLLGSGQDAEDVLQDAFERLWTHSWDTPAWKTILYRIALNRARDLLRRRKSLGAPADFDAVAAELYDPTPEPGEGLIRSEMTAQLNHALQELSFNQRAAVLLTLGDHSTQEIARILKVTPGTVRNLRYQATQIIRSYLNRLEDTND